jgi:hypothetical protein
MLFSTFFEDYAWTLPALAGMALVLFGNLLVMWRPTSSRRRVRGLESP